MPLQQKITQELLPHDIDAEEAVLGCLLVDGEYIADVTFLNPADFYRERNGWILGAMQRLHLQGKPIDTIMTGHELSESHKLEGVGGPAYLSYLISRCSTPYNTRHWALIVKDMADRRRVIAKAGEDAGKAFEGGEGWRQIKPKRPSLAERKLAKRKSGT